jgi:hypothetical protein
VRRAITDRSHRSKHGALALAAVYVELTTRRQAALQLEQITSETSNIHTIVRATPAIAAAGECDVATAASTIAGASSVAS